MPTLLAHSPEIGPGYSFIVSGIPGPNPNDDYCLVDIDDVATHTHFVGWVGLLAGASFIQGVFGTASTKGFPRATFPNGFVFAYPFPLAPGAAMEVHWYQYHANNNLVAEQVFGGRTWDIGGLYVLQEYAAQLVGGGGAASLSDILAAVKKAY